MFVVIQARYVLLWLYTDSMFVLSYSQTLFSEKLTLIVQILQRLKAERNSENQ